MITCYNLFGRDPETARERHLLRDARRTAWSQYQNRFKKVDGEYILENHWDVPREDITLAMIEHRVIVEIIREHNLDR